MKKNDVRREEYMKKKDRQRIKNEVEQGSFGLGMHMCVPLLIMIRNMHLVTNEKCKCVLCIFVNTFYNAYMLGDKHTHKHV